MFLTKKISISILFMLSISCVNAVSLDEYVYKNYLASSKKYGYEPKNQYKEIKNVVEKKLNIADRDTSEVSRINNLVTSKISQLNKDLENKLIYEKTIKTKHGEFVFFHLLNNEGDINNTSIKKPFLHSFALIKNNSALLPTLEVTIEDIETGGYTRKLWDVFEYNSKVYILVFNRIYESHVFELYTIQNNSIIKSSDIEFGGL